MQRFEVRPATDIVADTVAHAFLCARPEQIVSVFQFPGYAAVLHAGEPCYFITGYGAAGINFFAAVTANGRKYYNIQFGPVAADAAVLAAGIRFLIKHFRYKALCLTVQLPCPEDDKLRMLLPGDTGGHSFNDRYNWSTLLLPIAASAEEQFLLFSKHHQRSIKKAGKAGVQVSRMTDAEQVRQFSAIYIKMYRHRKLYTDESLLPAMMEQLQERFAASGYTDGAIWGIYHNGIPVGGIVVTYTGGTAFYYMGATDPDQRSFPLLHIAFAAVLDDCRSRGIKYFDFGGFALHAAKDSQEEKINRFKMQFGGQVQDYTPRLYFDLVPGGTKLLRFLRKLKN